MTRPPLRVCYLIDRLYPGGTESQLLALVRHLDREHVLPYLVLLDGADAVSRELEPDDCPVLRLGVHALHRPHALAAAWRFGRFLRRERIDVVQVCFPDSTYFGVTAARLARVPRVLRTRFNLGYWMTGLHRRLERLFGRWADATVTNCDAVRQSILMEERLAPDRVVVLENGVDVHRFAHLTPLDPSSPPRRVGLVANLRPVKDPEAFVRAAHRLAATFPDATFHVAGDGPLRPQLEAMIRELGLAGRVVLRGSVADVPAFLGKLDVAVLCSRSEGLSNAVLEYMAAGRAIVATAVGGNSQLIEDGVNGVLVPPGDAGRLADALAGLLSDPTRAARLGAAARRRVSERYSMEARARRFETFYEGLFPQGEPERSTPMNDNARQRTRFFRLYNRVLQRFSNQLFRPVLTTPPLPAQPEADVVLYTLLGRRDCRAYLLASKSFLRYGPAVRVVVQDDGSLDAACRCELETHVPGIEMLGREETPRYIRQHASELLLQALGDLERCHFLILLKLVNVVLRFPGRRVILFDSDLLFLREPTFVLNWLARGEGSFYSDGGSGLAAKFHEIGFDFSKVDVADFNSGLLGFRNTVTETDLAAVLNKIEEYDPELLSHWEIEQSIWAVLFNGFERPVSLDAVQKDYVGSGYWTCERLVRDSVLAHFVGSIRFKNLRYLRLARKVIAELKAGRDMRTQYSVLSTQYSVPGGSSDGPASPKESAVPTESRPRALARAALVGFFSLLTAPLWLLCRLQATLTGGEGCFAACAEFLSLFPGRLGIYLRRGFYQRTLDEYAPDASLGFGTILTHRQVRVGRGVYVGPRCTVGRAVLADHVTIGANVDILSGRRQHHFDDLETPVQKQGGTFQAVRIGRNCWIGNSTVVMADVGADCVIGAGSVVVRPIPPRSVAAGNPATVKKQRSAAARKERELAATGGAA